MKQPYPYFSQNPLDRLDQLRRDSDKIYELIHDENARFVLFDGNQIIVNEKEEFCFFNADILDEFMINDNQLILLGQAHALTYFAVTLRNEVQNPLKKVSLRDFVRWDYISQEQLGILAQGSSLLQWHDAHTFCSACGHATIMAQGGNRRDCLNCEKEHFPRVDPVVIMLVTSGEYCLLGRSYHFKEGFYSCLAGYVESGESFEEAAKREVYEEAGVQCEEVQYLLSQPWPFPSTLMVGMRMKAKAQELKLDKHELEDAIWVHKCEVKEVLKGSTEYHFKVPSKIAIARNLLEIWVKE